MNYVFTEDNGNLVEYDYPTLSNKIDRSNILDTIRSLYEINGKSVSVTMVSGFSDVFEIVFDESLTTEYIIAKATTPGGRQGLVDEQRIQINGSSFHYLFRKGEEGFNTAVLGFYQYFDKLVVTAWKSVNSSSTNPISKQIKVGCISEALTSGFCQQKLRNQDAYYCAFLPGFYNFYMKYKIDIHSTSLNSILSTGEMALSNLSSYYDKYPRQLIYFGAPGTGKSNRIEEKRLELLKECEKNYERVTFHPDYSYAHFVGTYKPVPKEGDDSVITYKYVPGPFLRTFVNAKKNPDKPYLLIIEEINRVNCSAVFGDVFQLLDRKDNVSEYPIQTSEDMRKYFADELGGESLDYSEIRIPNNMFIWATMNSADQGVFPMDTAFKRRWNFEYISIDENEEKINVGPVNVGENDNARSVKWNDLRKYINKFLLNNCHVNEDKLLGPFFINPNDLEQDKFIDAFKNKVLMYLFDDAAKHKRADIFSGAKEPKLFSSILSDFDKKGVLIFDTKIHSSFSNQSTEDNTDSNNPSNTSSNNTEVSNNIENVVNSNENQSDDVITDGE